MPEITESTPRESYTIAGKTFNLVQPFAEGHRLSANEASAMNQLFAENIRNNFAATVKESESAGAFDQEVMQGKLDDYMSEYEFGQRRGGGGRVGDPVEAEALNIARDRVRKAIKKQGLNLADYSTKAINAKAKEALDKYPQLRETARKIVEARKLELDGGEEFEVSLDSESAHETAEAPVPEAPKHSRKGHAHAAA